MDLRMLLISLFLYCYHITPSISEQASFYGNSYISIPFEESKTRTDISFRFRTRLADALIVLVAGTTDYCKVDLENGKLRVVVNLGSGEAELIAHSTSKLNDFKWHDVTISRRDSNLSITIDKARKVQTRIPGKTFHLDIHYGLFVGDHRNKNNSDLFFGHIKTFRGCLAGLKYNDILILETARQRHFHAIVEGITWNCAAEFEASLEQPISFVEDDAFFVIPQKIHNKEINIKMEVKTLTQDGLLFYNPGFSKQDFLLLGIANHSLIALIKVNGKSMKLSFNNKTVADGVWKRISFRLTTTTVELSLNEELEFLKNTHATLIHLADISYVGGLERNRRFRATQKGCGIICDVSFKGCLRELYVTEQLHGLPDAQVSEGLLPGCVWEFPCLRKPCIQNAICLQRGFDSFQCQCEYNHFTNCIKQNYSEGYSVFSHSPSLATELELLSVEPLEVIEGGSEIITTGNLHLVLDYHKYGIRDSGVNFSVDVGPDHGVVTVESWPHRHSFSLLDVARDKVHYVHDGSEQSHDSITLAVEFLAADTFTLPVYLQGRFGFTLAINVEPKNDPPVFDTSETKVLRVVQGSKKLITSDLFKTEDPDNNPSELIYTILKSDGGYFEHLRKIGSRVDTFAQEDIDKKKIVFVHTSPEVTDSNIALQISDGIEASSVYNVRVSVTPQIWRLDKNTGIQLLHQTWAIITSNNLSYTSNVANADYKVLFKMVKKPKFGDIEVEKSLNMWESTDVFSNVDLKQRRVRYRHLIGDPEFDEFQFRTALNKSLLYTFRLTFVECKLYRISSKTLELNSVWEAPITSRTLLFGSEPSKSLASISYQIIQYPEYGYFFSSVSKYRMKCFDNFTQEDINSENIRYRLYQKAFSDVTDLILLSVNSLGCGNSTSNITIKYYPSNDDKFKVQVNIKQLDVEEGMSAVIDRSHLYINASFVTDLIFNVTTPPKHGMLQIERTNALQNYTRSFTVQELNDNRVFYLHDGSETVRDGFKFMALANSDETFQYVGRFNINIHLKNDHSPIRTIDKVFQVVVGGEKLVTGNDLRYIDLDLGTPTSGIVYTCREVPNGQFFNVKNIGSNITEFTQQDLDDNLILFKHKGPEYGKIRLWVTDGQFHVNGILEIQASGPFIHAEMKKKIIVETGKSITISSDNLFYSTNLYTADDKVFFQIISGPTFGRLVDVNASKVLETFTQRDINLGRVRYINDVTSGADEIGFKIRCKDAVNLAQIPILILPSSYWEPLQLKRLKKLTVEESTSALITKGNLEVLQPNVPSSIIVYHIQQRPKYGYLTILSESKNGSEIINVACFSQDLINENRVLYIQAGMNHSRDTMKFNVTNGLVWLTNLQLEIVIIPEKWYLGSHEIIVPEGGTVPISTVHIYVESEYFRPKSITYKVVDKFLHGCILIYKQCTKSNSFTERDLSAGIVEYSHDGSENLNDYAILTAKTQDGKESEPVTLTVSVLPINDNVPKLINNTGMEMWEGGQAIITNSMLAAIDLDMPKETLKYHVQSCWWGNITLITDSKTGTNYFTQQHIDDGLVNFKHLNGSKARFLFNVSDGLHTTKDYLFEIRTKRVELRLLNNKPLHVFPLQKKSLLPENLLAKNSDARKILYEVVKSPDLGRLMMKSKKREHNIKVSNFTQEDINNRTIYYEHLQPISDLYANDSFIFNVKAYLAPTLENKIFRIDISVSSGGLDSYVQVPKISVDEGGLVNVALNLSQVVSFLEMHAGLHSPMIHVSAEVPQHGRLFLQNDKNGGLMTFTQLQLESGQVFYQHDNSDTLSDKIHFSLYLIPGFVLLCNLTANVTINPVNDQPFRLITPAPSFVVVQGENHTITSNELCTKDVDTAPYDIKYDLVNGPSSGYLLLLPDLEQVTHFTQADIDQSRLVYVHNSAVLKDSFHLRVWDEKFKPEFTFFNIVVVPVNLTIKSGIPLQMRQGDNVAVLNERNIFIETNANVNKIVYKILKGPKYGVIFKENNQTVAFTQRDVYNNQIMYLQLDTTASNDSFHLTGSIFVGDLSLTQNFLIYIMVKADINTKDCNLKSGETSKITLNVLDATSLAKRTNSNPKYSLVYVPSFCQVRKIIRSTGERKHVLDTAVTSFTHEEVKGGLIYLYVKDVEATQRGETDKIVFILAASIFQPAVGELIIHIKPDKNDLFSSLPDPHDPEGHEGDVLLTTPNITRDYILIVTVVLAIVVTTIVIIIVIRCKSIDRGSSNKEEVPLGSLPRPPDRLLASPIKALPATAPPQCKVTPLALGEFDTPSSRGAPYGVADDLPDEWSSLENSSDQASKSIMLRRNQYWV